MKPLLIDLDGVLKIGKETTPYLKEFLDFLKNSEIQSCILSNSTLSTSSDVKEFFYHHKIEVSFPIITTPDAALLYVKEKYRRVSVYCEENVKAIFREFIDDDNPEAVIMGDMGKKWDFKILNEIFLKVMNSSDLIALQMNKFWKTKENGLLLDAGPFVKAIEYATNKKAVLIGKPAPLYFKTALKILNADDKKGFIMLGDDLDTDIAGAKNLGGTTILIYTGKTTKPLAENVHIKPDYQADDLKEVIEILKEQE